MAAGNILKTRTALWPLFTLIFFTSSMSGSEFIAQRKLAFHVFGSHVLPSTYFPADAFFMNWSPLSAFLAEFAEQVMSCSPVWMAHSLNRLASLSIAQPCLAACFQGIENIVFSCKNTNRNTKYSFSEDFSYPRRSSSERAPHLVQPSQTLNGVGVDHPLQPRPHPHPCHGHVAWKLRKGDCQTRSNSARSSFRITAACRKKGAEEGAEFTFGACRRSVGRLAHAVSKGITNIVQNCFVYVFVLFFTLY